MEFLRNKWAIATLALVCWGVIASFSTAYYYYLYTDLFEKLRTVPVHISVIVAYGNGTTKTFPDVYLFRNATALDSLRAVANVTLQYTEFGVLVTSVDGVSNDWGGAGVGWQYWVDDEWGSVAADRQILISGNQVTWNCTTWGGP